jgi:hypothetical protein
VEVLGRFQTWGLLAGISRSLDSLHGEPHGLLNRSLSGAIYLEGEAHASDADLGLANQREIRLFVVL